MVSANKDLEKQLKEKEERLLQSSKQEGQTRHELLQMTITLEGLTKSNSDQKERILKLEELRSNLESQITELNRQAESLKKEVDLKETLLFELNSTFRLDIASAKTATEKN
jgi:chromosome segregation ATPase